MNNELRDTQGAQSRVNMDRGQSDKVMGDAYRAPSAVKKEREKERERKEVAIVRLCHVRLASLQLKGMKCSEQDGAEPFLSISSSTRQRKVLCTLPIPSLSSPPSDGFLAIDRASSFQYSHSVKLPDNGANELRFSICVTKGKRQMVGECICYTCLFSKCCSPVVPSMCKGVL